METTWRDRLRYRIDEFFGRGTIALILGLAVVSILIILVIAFAVVVFGAGGENSLVDLVWMGLMRTLDPGTMGGDEGSGTFLGAMLVVTLGGIFVISALIGIINTGIQDRLAELRKGRSRVIESDHTVILGWNQQVFTILSELVGANANQRGKSVVVLADRDKVEMDDEIRARIPDARGTKIVCRSGSPVDLDEIDIAGIQRSRAVIVLAPEVDEPDIEVIKTILAITNDPNRRPEPYHVVAEIHEPANLEAARLVGRDEVELVVVGDVVSRIIAQTCRQAGLSIVYGELLDFDGDEIYFSHQPTLAGRSFGDAQLAFEDSTLIGVATKGGAVRLNPAAATRPRRGRPAHPHRGGRRRDQARRWVGCPGRRRRDHRLRPDAGREGNDAHPRLEPPGPPDRPRARCLRRARLGDHGRERRPGRHRGRGAPPSGPPEPGPPLRGQVTDRAGRARLARRRLRTSTCSSSARSTAGTHSAPTRARS